MQISLTIIFLFIFLALLLLLGMLFYFSARLLLSVAFNRSAPRLFNKTGALSRVTKSNDFVNTLTEKSRLLKERDTETVEIQGYGGVMLKGHVLPSDTPRRLVIAVHGWRGSWNRDFGIISDFWLSNDATVLYVEQRGQQGSGGDTISFGLCERYDIIEWVNWAQIRFPELPIYLCGVSMGASSVLMSSSLGLPRRVHGIIADSGFTSPIEIWRHVISHNLRLPYALYSRAARRECERRTGQSADSCSTLTALSECRVPVLFIHGDADSFVPIEMTYRNYSACPSPKRLFVIHGANHCMGYYIDPVGYEREMSNFWEKYD